MEPADVGGRKFRTAFVLILAVAVSALFLAVTWPFLKPLLLGALLAGLCRPLYQWITRLLGGRRSLGAVITLLVLFILVVGPLSVFLGVVVATGAQRKRSGDSMGSAALRFGRPFNAHDWLVQKFPTLADHVPSQEELVEDVGTAAKGSAPCSWRSASRMTRTAAFLLDFFVMLYAMFFFFKDGETILEQIFYYLPLSHEDEPLMLQRFTSITRATVKGTLVVGVIQGALAGIAFWAAGIGGAAFWGTIMAILSIVPGIGAALIWVPASHLFVYYRPDSRRNTAPGVVRRRRRNGR